jgi:hypothetical protein
MECGYGKMYWSGRGVIKEYVTCHSLITRPICVEIVVCMEGSGKGVSVVGIATDW